MNYPGGSRPEDSPSKVFFCLLQTPSLPDVQQKCVRVSVHANTAADTRAASNRCRRRPKARDRSGGCVKELAYVGHVASTKQVCHYLMAACLAIAQVGILEFSRDRKMMSVRARRSGADTLFVKGAPESILQRCTQVGRASLVQAPVHPSGGLSSKTFSETVSESNAKGKNRQGCCV